MSAQPVENNERPIDLRAELTNMLSVVDGNVTITREQMEAIGDHLQTLWGKAHDAHDEAALVVITDLWDRAQLLVEQNASLAFQVTGMGSIAVSALEGERATRKALDNIEDAIDSVDEEHPRLYDFSQTIRADAEEEYQEGLEEWVLPEVRQQKAEELNHLLFNTVAYLTGCPDFAIAGFIRLLKGRRHPTAQQIDMLRELVASFANQEAASGH